MPAPLARRTLEGELGGAPLGSVFEWIDLDAPVGSASVAQVHKARLRGAAGVRRRSGSLLGRLARSRLANPVWAGRVRAADAAAAAPPPGALVLEAVPAPPPPAPPWPAALAAAAAAADPAGPAGPAGLVAVKIQTPGAAATMADDLKHVRTWGRILSASEIAFDMVSAVDELNKQVGLEFDFVREARIQDAVARHLGGLAAVVAVPRSVPGLVTPRLLTMGFVEGDQIGRLEVRKGQERRRGGGKRRIAMGRERKGGARPPSIHLLIFPPPSQNSRESSACPQPGGGRGPSSSCPGSPGHTGP
jgi:predicted unusual protein kinase regulating ubiquinone biosynthesis (AarF/ABC1/UbiB family)